MQEAPVDQAQYEMPPVSLGQRVLWFQFGDRGKVPHIAFVIEKKRSTIKVRTVGNEVRSAIRHMGDPRLRESEEQRRDHGGWDYTEEEVEDRKFKADALERLTKLEQQINGLIANAASAQSRKKE
jgi:predicted transcriptional regulator